jgi:tetratricopeptide (TPR) repeat protein
MKKILTIVLVLLACNGLRGQSRGLDVTRSDNNGQGQRRVALVIGNANYKTSSLRNPVTDAKDMAQALAGFGFEVIYKTDLSQNEMKRAIREFGEKIQQGGTGLFYYAGHAVQVDGRNYLIPVGAEITSEHEVEYESVDVGLLLSQMQDAHNELNIVILDACRNNPFSRKFRSANEGLASINAPSGTLIAYATAPGAVASDGEGRNGLYTQELLKAMREPGLKIEDVFKRVRRSVQNYTGSKQTPWESSSLVGDFYFLPGEAKPKSAPEPDRGPRMDGETGRVEPPASERAPITNPSPKPVRPNPTAAPSALSKTAAEVFIKQGDAEAKQKHWAGAEGEYRQAVELDPQNARLRAKLGDVLVQQKKWDEAEAQYTAALQLEPQNKSYQDRLNAVRNRPR